MTFLKFIAITVPVTLALDFLWLGVLAKNFYNRHLGPLMRQADGALAPIWASAAVVYVLIPVGVALFVMPLAGGSPLKALGWGALFGVILYGVYDFTNHSLLKDWPFIVVAVDVVWGAVLCGLTAVVTFYIASRLGWTV